MVIMMGESDGKQMLPELWALEFSLKGLAGRFHSKEACQREVSRNNIKGETSKRHDRGLLANLSINREGGHLLLGFGTV